MLDGTFTQLQDQTFNPLFEIRLESHSEIDYFEEIAFNPLFEIREEGGGGRCADDSGVRFQSSFWDSLLERIDIELDLSDKLSILFLRFPEP